MHIFMHIYIVIYIIIYKYDKVKLKGFNYLTYSILYISSIYDSSTCNIDKNKNKCK